jgi:uncharacterized protein involved in exopolysaccharide biosynthesis
MGKKEADILDLLLVISKHKKFIIIITLIVSIIAVIYSLSATKYWASKATILPAKNQASSTLTSFLGTGSSLFQGGLQPASTELIMIMKSRSFNENIIDKFNLIKYFKIKNSDDLLRKEKAVEILSKKVRSIGLDEETGLISVKIETKDRNLSADIANYYCDLLDNYNKNSRKTKGKLTRLFIEKRINEVRSTLDSLSIALNEFKKKNKSIDLPSQTEKVIELYSDIVSQKINNDMEIGICEKFLSPSSPKLEELEYKQKLIINKINQLEFIKSTDAKYILSLDNIPDLSLEYSNLLMNIKIFENVYEFLYPEYESAKIQEYKDLPTIEIIDRAIPAGERSKPKRARICIMAFLIALVFSIVYSIIIEEVRKYIILPEKSNKWKEIKRGFKKNKCSQKK